MTSNKKQNKSTKSVYLNRQHPVVIVNRRRLGYLAQNGQCGGWIGIIGTRDQMQGCIFVFVQPLQATRMCRQCVNDVPTGRVVNGQRQGRVAHVVADDQTIGRFVFKVLRGVGINSFVVLQGLGDLLTKPQPVLFHLPIGLGQQVVDHFQHVPPVGCGTESRQMNGQIALIVRHGQTGTEIARQGRHGRDAARPDGQVQWQKAILIAHTRATGKSIAQMRRQRTGRGVVEG
jgi:hypothetical protein